jgi:hypothetical protein
VGGVGAAALGGGGSAPATAPAPAQQPAQQPAGRAIVYRITGTAPKASLTMTNGQGGVEQHDANLPWERELTVPDGAAVSLSAQNAGEKGRLACEILLDGKPWKRSEASAAYGIASCDGLVGLD